MTKDDAKKLLKLHKLKIADLANLLDVQPRAVRDKWNSTLSISHELELLGFVSTRDALYQALNRHRNNPALLALLDELDKHSQNPVKVVVPLRI